MHPKRLIWFCETERVAEDLDALDELRDKIGLTTIMPESFICHTSGFAASPEIVKSSPFEDWRTREQLHPRARQGIYPAVCGTVGGFDDAPLLRVIERCRSLGIEIWGHIGLWSYGGDVYPEYAMVDIDQKPLDPRYKQWGIGLCPSRPRLVNWTRDCLVDVAQRYDIDGFDVDHSRYPAPGNLSSLFACACPSCQEEASRLGYDFQRMKAGLVNLKNSLGRLTSETIKQALQTNPDFWLFLSFLGADPSVVEWFEFRSKVLAIRMQEFRTAVQETAGKDKVFGSDVFPPSIALLGGHDYNEWELGSDFLTGGSSSGGVVGWATTVTNLATEWAPALCRLVPDLEERDALQLVYQLFGYEDFELPLSVKEIQNGELPIAKMYDREVIRLRTRTSGTRPIYPPISASGPPDLVRQLCDSVTRHKCNGMLFSGRPNAENLSSLGDAFASIQGRPIDRN